MARVKEARVPEATQTAYPRETRKARLRKLVAALKNERASFELQWRECADFVLPTRPRWMASDRNKGDRRNQKIVDPTATLALGTLRSGMHSGMTSPARQWFRLAPPDPSLEENGAVKDWLHDVRARMLAVMLRSNVYQALPVFYQDMGAFGTAAMAVMEDDQDVIRCYDFPIGSYYLALDETRRVSVFAHEYSLSVRQIVAQFASPNEYGEPQDWSKISDGVRDMWLRGTLDAWVDVVQVIQKNDGHDDSRLESKYKAFYSCHFEASGGRANDPDDDVLLEEKGFDEFPVLAGRWDVTGNDVYATNWPAATAIGDVKELQLLKRRGATALDKVINPPVVAPLELRNQGMNLLPGGMIYARENAQSQVRSVYQIAPDFNALREEKEAVRAIIRRSFAEDLFLMLAQMDRANVTATEILERREEKMQTLGPVYERLNDEVLEPLVDRVFAIMVRKGLLPPAPEELQGMTLRVEYESIMSQAMKQSGLGAMERFRDNVLVIAQSKPDVLDKVDFDQWVDESGQMLGVPPRVIVPDDMAAAVRAERAKQMQAQQAAETAATEAAAARDLAGADTSSKNALTDLMTAGTVADMGAGAMV
jgi:hypothetical protein